MPGHPDIFVIGDLAKMMISEGVEVPGVAQGALQGGKHVAKLIADEVRGRGAPPDQRAPFRYHDKGNMATIGRASAVAETKRFAVSGFFAWMLWWVVHIIFLVGFRSRVMVMLTWAWSWITFKRGARLHHRAGRRAAEDPSAARRRHDAAARRRGAGALGAVTDHAQRHELVERRVVRPPKCCDRRGAGRGAMRDEVAHRRERVQAIRERDRVIRRATELPQVAKPRRMVDREHEHHARPLGDRQRRVEALASMLLQLAHRVRHRAQRHVDVRAADVRGIVPLRLEPARVALPAGADHVIDVLEQRGRLALQARELRPEPRVDVVLEHLHPQRDRGDRSASRISRDD